MAHLIPQRFSELITDVIAYTNGPVLLARSGTFFAIALLTVLFWSYSRLLIVKSFGKDDRIMFLVMACATACFTSYAYQISLGVGAYVAVIQTDQGVYRQIPKARQFHMVAVVVGISLAKISVGFFLMRLAVRRLSIYFLWGLVIFSTCFKIACTCTLCMPIWAAWDIRLRPPPIGNGHARCSSEKTFGQNAHFNGTVNFATDVVLALLPIPLIWTLRMSARLRIALAIVLGLGVFAAVAGIIRQASIATNRDPESWFHDTYAIWNFIELDIGIIAASLPATKPLLSRIYKAARSLTRGFRISNPSSKNITVYIRHPGLPDIEAFGVHLRTVPLSAESGKAAEHNLPRASKDSSGENGGLPSSYSPGKGEILVTQHVEITTS